MTDLEKFLALYKSFGIELFAGPLGPGPDKKELLRSQDADKAGLVVRLRQDQHDKLEGYGGFCSAVFFDSAGSFLFQGFLE